MNTMSHTLTLLMPALATLLPTIAHAERRVVCKPACVEAIDACAASRAPMRFKKAKRQCRRQLMRACKRTGTAACAVAPPSTTTTLAPAPGVTTSTTTTTTTTSTPVTTTTSSPLQPDGLPHFRGDYTFTGTQTASTCPPLAAFPAGELAMPVTILNGGFGTWLDGLMWGVDATGERQPPPWWLQSQHDCIAYAERPDAYLDWCAKALLTVGGWPPATPAAPAPPATVVFSVEFYVPFNECTVTYSGTLARASPGG